MPILLTCECGKKLKVGDDKVGKRVKCPGCQAVLTVPTPEAVEEPEPPRKLKVKSAPLPEPEDEPEPPRKAKVKPAPPSPDDDGDDEEMPEPTVRGKKKPSSEPKKSSAGKLGFILALVALLMFGGCGGVVALWYLEVIPDPFGKSTTFAPKIVDGKTDKGKTDGMPPKDTVIEPRTRFPADPVSQGNERGMMLSHDGSRFMFNGKGKSHLWDITGEPKKLHEFDGDILALSPDGKRAVHNKNGQRSLVDAQTGAEIAAVTIGGRPWFTSDTVLWDFHANFNPFKNPKDRIIAKSYDAATGKMDKEYEFANKGPKQPLIDEKGQAYLVSEAGVVHLWDPSSNQWGRQITVKPDQGEKVFLVTTFALSSDGKWLLTNAGKGTFDPVAFDLSTGAGVKIPKQGMFPRTPAFIPNRDILMVNKSLQGTKKDQLLAYDLKTNAVVGTFGTVDGFVNSLTISGDGSTMAAASSEGEVVIWDLKKLN